MTIRVYPIAGKSSAEKSVAMYHSNKYLHNFHWALEEDVNRIYNDWPAGEYILRAGYQNGYEEIGITYIKVETR